MQGELLAEFRPQLGDDFVDSRTIARGRFNTGLYKGPPDEQCHVSPIESLGEDSPGLLSQNCWRVRYLSSLR